MAFGLYLLDRQFDNINYFPQKVIYSLSFRRCAQIADSLWCLKSKLLYMLVMTEIEFPNRYWASDCLSLPLLGNGIPKAITLLNAFLSTRNTYTGDNNYKPKHIVQQRWHEKVFAEHHTAQITKTFCYDSLISFSHSTRRLASHPPRCHLRRALFQLISVAFALRLCHIWVGNFWFVCQLLNKPLFSLVMSAR